MLGVALSVYFVTDKFCTDTLPPPPPDPRCIVPDWVMPQLHDNTSISFLCTESSDSPCTEPSFRKISTAMSCYSLSVLSGGTQPVKLVWPLMRRFRRLWRTAVS